MKRLLVVLAFFLACAAMESPGDYQWTNSKSDAQTRVGECRAEVPDAYEPAGFACADPEIGEMRI